MRSYTAIIERCQHTGLYVGFIPGFQGAHTQAESMDELNQKTYLRDRTELLEKGLYIALDPYQAHIFTVIV